MTVLGMTGTAPRLAALLLAAGATGACPAQGAVAPAPCVPVQATAAGVRADSLAGEFRLTLVATQGARAGHATTGRLRLMRYTPGGPTAPAAQAQPGVRFPLHGAATLALDSVGAVSPGDVGSADARRPGVLVMEWQRGDGASPTPRPQVTLRLGADANAGETGRIEGTHLALFVDQVSAGRFAGRWDSGVEGQRSGGHFCAERVAAAR